MRITIGATLAAILTACSAPEGSSAGATSAASLATEATAFYQEFQSATNPCDAAGEQAKATLQKGDAVAGYRALKDAEASCKAAFMAVTNMKVPEGGADAGTALTTAKDSCGVAYYNKRNAYRDFAKVLNGDDRPSAQAEAAHSSERADEGLAACVSQMTQAVHDAGGA